MGKRHRQPHHRAAPAPSPTVDRVQKEEARDVVYLYGALGCRVVHFSQPRATMQTEGIPDLKVYCVRKGYTWWHEVKRPSGGRVSDAQKQFAGLAKTCGELYVLG